MNDTVNLWPLRLLAVLIAVIAWLFASFLPRLEDLSSPLRTKIVSATVNYDAPPGFLVLDPPATVEVLLRGSQDAVRDLNPFQVDVDVPLEGVIPGPVQKLLGPENVSLPEGLEVVSIRPDRLPLRIDREETRLILVKVDFTGEPAAGYQPERPGTAVPDHVEVRGPESRLALLTQVLAEVNVAGRAISFDAEIPVRSPDPLVQIVQPGQVKVHVTMLAPGSPVNGSASPAGGTQAGTASR